MSRLASTRVRAGAAAVTIAAAWLVSAGGAAGAAPREPARAVREYTEIVTPQFTLLTSQPPAEARSVAQRLWAFRLALESLLGAPLESAVPVTIFALDGESWRRYAAPRSGLAGWFSGEPFAADLMFDASTGAQQALELTLHEYTHHLLRALGAGPGRLPPFLDEGLAELFGTARFTRDALRFAPRADHITALRGADWLPFERVLEVGRRDAEFMEHGPARLFYAQAWATAYYVLAGDSAAGRTRLPAYLATLREIDADGGSAVRERVQRRAAEQLVGHPAASANEAIRRAVLRGGSLGEPSVPLPRAAREPVPMALRRIGADEFEVRLAELMLRLGNRATLARGLLRAVPEDSPFAPRARVGAALAVLQSGELPFASALLDDPALASGIDAATGVRLGRGLLQLGLPSSQELAGTVAGAGTAAFPADEALRRRQRLERSRDLFAAALATPGASAEATWGYVLATLSLGRREPDLLDRAIQAYATAPGNPELAIAVAMVLEAEGHAPAARRFWAEAARNLRPGPERDRVLARGAAAYSEPERERAP